MGKPGKLSHGDNLLMPNIICYVLGREKKRSEINGNWQSSRKTWASLNANRLGEEPASSKLLLPPPTPSFSFQKKNTLPAEIALLFQTVLLKLLLNILHKAPFFWCVFPG